MCGDNIANMTEIMSPSIYIHKKEVPYKYSTPSKIVDLNKNRNYSTSKKYN